MDKIAYIVTARFGLPAFVFREIDDINKNSNFQIIPYIMKNGKGNYNTKSEWNARYWNLRKIFVGFLVTLFKNPVALIRSVYLSLIYIGIIDLAIALAFINDLRKDKPKKILAFEGLHAIRIAYFINLLTSINYSVIVHAEMLRVNKHYFKLTKMAIDKCEYIISPTILNKKKISKKFEVDLKKIIINRMSIDTKKYKTDNRFKILIVGYYNERKGHETLLKAIKFLDDSGIVVWIAGKDMRRGDYFDVKKFVNQNDLSKNVRILGDVSDEVLHILFDCCDIFSLPCKTPKSGIIEGLPVALMEAMSYSKPVLSTKHTGIPELVQDSLVEENDYKSLAKEILKYKKNIELKKKIGIKNRKIIENYFSNNNIKMIQKILK